MWAVIFVYFPVTFLNSPVQAYENPRLSKQEASKQEKISINSNNFKSKSPLFITLHPQQITLSEEETNRLKEWINNASLSGQNIHIYSYATPPINRLNITKKSVLHNTIRKSFNRAVEVKKFLKDQGVLETQITLHAIEPVDKILRDQLHITIKN